MVSLSAMSGRHSSLDDLFGDFDANDDLSVSPDIFDETDDFAAVEPANFETSFTVYEHPLVMHNHHNHEDASNSLRKATSFHIPVSLTLNKPSVRHVSVQGLSDLRRTEPSMAGVPSHFESLKELSRQKLQNSALVGGRAMNGMQGGSRFTNGLASIGEEKSSKNFQFSSMLQVQHQPMVKKSFGVSSVFDTPTSGLNSFLSNLNRTNEPAPSVPTPIERPTAEQSALHRACCKFGASADVISQLLRHDPGSAARPVTLRSTKAVYNPAKMRAEQRVVKEPYSYPLNLALKYKQSPQVIALLIDAAPSVLTLKDGAQDETPLCVLLKNSPHDLASVEKIVFKAPQCVSMRDRHDNTAIHVACTRNCSLEILKRIATFYPQALKVRNAHGKTPLELAQQRTLISEEVSKFLWEQQEWAG